MVFEDGLKEDLIEIEVKLIVLSYGISDKLGAMAINTATQNFYDYLCRGLGKDRIVSSMNMEYRKFIIDLLESLPDELLPRAMSVILGVNK